MPRHTAPFRALLTHPRSLSQDNFRDVQVPKTLLVSFGAFAVSFVAVLGVALLG